MATVKKVEVTFDDDSTQVLTQDQVVAPTDTEVDIVMSDGTVKKFVPAE